MTACVYIAVWGFTEVKETFIGFFDKSAAPLMEKDDMDFVYIPCKNKDYSILLFNLPMRATPRDAAIQYILHTAHAHILIDPGLEVARVIKAYIPQCEGTGLIYSWHKIDVDGAGLELIPEPANEESAMQLLHHIAKTTKERDLLLPPVLPMKPLEAPKESVSLPEITAESNAKQGCKK